MTRLLSTRLDIFRRIKKVRLILFVTLYLIDLINAFILFNIIANVTMIRTCTMF